MSKLTIGYVLDDTLDVMDGVQQAMVSIGEHMRERGHDVHYIVPLTRRSDLLGIHSIGNFLRIPFNGNSVRTPKFLPKKAIQELFASTNFDVLHVQMPYSPFFAGRVLRYAPAAVKKVGTFHILPYNWSASLGTTLLGMWMKKSHASLDSVFAVSKPALQFMRTSYGIEGDILPNPVDYEFYKQYAQQKKNDTDHIVFVGRFDERKGVRELTQAVKILRDNGLTSLRVTMCGKGPLHEWVKEYNIKHHLNIELPGFVSESQKAAILSEAMIAVFPSKSGESFGIVLTEAMSAGAGVVLAGNNPGYASVMEQWPQVLFDAKQPETIAEKIRYFLENTKEREAIGDEQQAYVAQFDIEHIVATLERVYQTSVAKDQ